MQTSNLLNAFLMENPVCKPITETNRAVPSFENIFSVLWAFSMISLFPFGNNLIIRNPTNMAANRIPAIPTEIPFMRILLIARPTMIIKSRRLSGERSVVREDIIHHQTTAYARDGYRATSFESCRSVCQRDNARRTIPHNRASFQALQARSLSNGQYLV